jgi:hypothetical protein
MKLFIAATAICLAGPAKSPSGALLPPQIQCETVCIYDDNTGLHELECLHTCGVYGCSLFPQFMPGYGTGYTCGCPVSGPTICCHLVAGYDAEGVSWSVPTGNCQAPYIDCDPGTCKQVNEYEGGGIWSFSAECKQ